MKYNPMLIITSLFLFFLSCSPNDRLSGVIINSSTDVIVLNKVEGRKAVAVEEFSLGKKGNFSFTIKDLEPGVYNLQISNRVILFVLDGTEKSIDLKADFNKIPYMDYEIRGSMASAELQAVLSRIMKGKMKAKDFHNLVSNSVHPFVPATVTINYLPMTAENFALHQRSQQKLASAYPNSSLAVDYGALIKRRLAKFQPQRTRPNPGSPVSVGQSAPEIDLPDPQGKHRKLSDLRGKVVVLDFWASWCGPCRRFGNPELVKLYGKYKEEQFAIYNVALERSSKNDRWIAAIEKDQLTWPHHVIDRSREVSQAYGVYGIPRTYVLDKEGKIAAINPHGEDLERAVSSLLKKG